MGIHFLIEIFFYIIEEHPLTVALSRKWQWVKFKVLVLFIDV
jgi:hypothetical protein